MDAKHKQFRASLVDLKDMATANIKDSVARTQVIFHLSVVIAGFDEVFIDTKETNEQDE